MGASIAVAPSLGAPPSVGPPKVGWVTHWPMAQVWLASAHVTEAQAASSLSNTATVFATPAVALAE